MNDIVLPLLTWYQVNKRSLPWRDQNNPYYTWISEIMLQQTRVEAVKDYFIRFIIAIPTIEALAQTEEDILMKLWEGLGYYSRARNLRKCAKQCVEQHGGALPSTYQELIELPGIGPYTAGAIASIAFHQPHGAIDGNVLRVMARLTNNHSDIASTSYKTHITNLIGTIIPIDQPGNFNQALMDLGATICIPNGAPHCDVCPLAPYCQAKLLGTANQLPIKQAKKARKIEQRTIVIVLQDNLVLLQKRSENGLLANLYEFINIPGKCTKKEVIAFLENNDTQKKVIVNKNEAREPDISSRTIIKKISKLASSKHIFTHLEWHMQGFIVELQDSIYPLAPHQRWVTMDEIDYQYTLPTALKTYRDYLFQIHSNKTIK